MQYTVESGDSISIIARDIVGDISRWPEIAAINNLAQPYVIYPGQVLEVPDPGTIQTGPATAAPPAPGAPAAAGVWWKNPWLWAGTAALVFFFFKPQRKKRSRRR